MVEVIDTIHRGENRGSKPVILNMFYFSSPGQEITIQHPELEQEEKSSIQPAITKERPKPTSKEEARVYKLVLALGEKVLPRRQLVAELGMKQNSRCTFTYNYMKPT